MLEGPLKSWICYFLGQYVESESVQVSAKLWKSSERLKLENLTLKASIIPSWLPFRLKSGFIGQFEADLPIAAIFGRAAAKIKFVDVLLVLEPLQHDDIELQDELVALVDEKMEHLEQDLLDRWSGPQQVPNEYTVPHESEGYFGTDGWIGRTMTKLIDNLQIDVRNLHIRIEGTWSPPPPPPRTSAANTTPPHSHSSSTNSRQAPPPPDATFAAGITLGALSAVTTPSNWRIDGFDDTAPDAKTAPHLVFKLISALELSAYVDPLARHCPLHSPSRSPPQSTTTSTHATALHATLARLRDMGSAKAARIDWWRAALDVPSDDGRHRFVVAPIAVSLKLTMNTATQHAQTRDPRYDAVFHLSKLSLALDEDQLSVLNVVVDAFTGHEHWRVLVSEHLKATERLAASDAVHMERVAREYALLWHAIMGVKKRDDLDALKKTDVWHRATAIEQQLPFEFVVALRNQSLVVSDTGQDGDSSNSDTDGETSAKAAPFVRLLHAMGDAMGIPLPEISVVFPRGATGLLLDVKPVGRSGFVDVVVKRCVDKSIAAANDAIKPGLLLIAVDNKPLMSQFRFKTAMDLQLLIDAMPASRVLTFRHPLVKPAEVTPQHLVARVALTSDTLTFRLVRAATKSVLAEATLEAPNVVIEGFGPDLFAFHRYTIAALDYFIQHKVVGGDAENAEADNGGNHCIASSVREPITSDSSSSALVDDRDHDNIASSHRTPSLQLVINYLYDEHPDADKTRAATFGSKIALHLGDSIVVFDEPKMTLLMREWHAFASSIVTTHDASSRTSHSSNGERLVPSSLVTSGQLSTIPSGTLSDATTTQSSPSSFVPSSSLNASLLSGAPPSTFSAPLTATTTTAAAPLAISYSYEVKMDHLQVFVSAATKAERPSNMEKQPSYRVLLKQLANKEAAAGGGGVAVTQPDWVNATRAIVVMQRFIRGCIVRKRKMVRLALTKSRWLYVDHQSDALMGWLFTRDDTLAFRRWRRSWCHLDDDAVLSMHDNGSGADLLDAFDVAGCNVILLPHARNGPFAPSNRSRNDIENARDDNATPQHTCHVLEIRTAAGRLRAVLSSTNLHELDKWKRCIESSARHALKRAQQHESEHEHDPTGDAFTDVVDDFVNSGRGFCVGKNQRKETANSSNTARQSRYLPPEQILLGGFADTYRPQFAVVDSSAAWITFSASDLAFAVDVHGVAEPEQSAFQLFLGLRYLSAVDHRRRESKHAFLHVGDEFLNLKNGVLTPSKLRSDAVASTAPTMMSATNNEQQHQFLTLRVTYRGAQAASDVFVLKNGLHVDVDVSGWVMPLTLTDLLFEVVDALDVLWTDPSDDAAASEHGETVPPAPTPASPPAPWYKVSELHVHVRAPMLEAYVEDSHCVAKLSIERSSFAYRADASVENLKVHLGPTALFVLTEEVALRLAQVDKFWVAYDLRLHKLTTDTPLECALCTDDSGGGGNGRRPHCHRSVVVSLGQVKLEADRRLELLFALLEALTHTDDGDVPDDLLTQALTTVYDNHPHDDATNSSNVAGFASPADMLVTNRSTEAFRSTERMPSMQFNLNDNDRMDELRPMYAGFGSSSMLLHRSHSASGSATGNESPAPRSRLSRVSTATSVGLHHMQSHDHERHSHERSSRPRSTASAFIPLLNYQTYFGILADVTEQCKPLRHRTLYRTRLRIGRVHDRLTMSCYSVVFEVIKRSLSVVALDTYIPVMNFALSDMKLQCLTRSEFTRDYNLDASLEISARYYNTALADWEPFIEPWRAYAKVRMDDDESHATSGGTSVEISAMQRLNVNFTDAFVRLLSSVAKNRRRQVMYIEKRTPAAVAADGEAKKEDGRVCVLNNLGVPIRLANLNTSHAGTLLVEVRDGWHYPSYARFHDVKVEVVLLPWWHPREAATLENLRHKFSLPYGGAQSGVTPILRVDVLSTDKGKRNFVFDHVTNKYVEVDDDMDDDTTAAADMSLSQIPSAHRLLARDESSSAAKEKWFSIGTVEINLAGSVMGAVVGTKLSRWYRLHDERGHATGEIFLALDFVSPASLESRQDARLHEPEQVRDGQFLVFDPLKIVATHAPKSKSQQLLKKQASGNLNCASAAKDNVVLSEGLRGSYIPPLALEVLIGSTRSSLLCPLRRAGKFLIQGDKVLAEVKVAQRDESRRVLLLSSPVQLKNGTSLDMEFWTCCTDLKPGESGLFHKPEKAVVLMTDSKISVPLSALFGDEKQSVIIKVDGCKPTVIADLSELAAGSSILTLEPEDGAAATGYCFYVNIMSFLRKVYREDHLNVVTRGGSSGVHGSTATTSTTSPDSSFVGELQTYATKYQICLHSCLVFENTLPIRVQFQVVVAQPSMVASGRFDQIVLRAGTLSPGDEVHLHEFQRNAQLLLRLPEMDSIWTRPINLGDCIYRDTMDRSVRAMLGAASHWDPVVEFLPSLPSVDVGFQAEATDSKKVLARLDYTAADDGSPRVVLYCSLWIYNQSHVQTMLFRCADDFHVAPHVLHAPQLVPERPVPRLMDCPGQAFEMSTIINHEVSRWSEKIHATVVGIQAPIALKFGSKLGPKSRNEIGISIQRPMGQFHRTTQVVVTPRFVFVNKTHAAFKVSQHGRDNDRVVELPVASGAFKSISNSDATASTSYFDFDHSIKKNAQREVYIRLNHSGAEWSGPFCVADEKEFPLKLKGAVPRSWRGGGRSSSSTDGYDRPGFTCSDNAMHRVRVRISTVGASMVVTLTRDDPPMYLICNESSSDLLVQQANNKDDMVIVRSREYVPFAWAKPDGARRVSCRAVAPGEHHASSPFSRVYDFANLDKEKNTAHGLKFWFFGKELRTISAEIVVERSSRVLVFRDHSEDVAPSYVLEVKVIAARLRNDISLRHDALAGVVVETDNHSSHTVESKEVKTAHVYRFDADVEFACTTRPKKLQLRFFELQRDDADAFARELAGESLEISDTDALFHSGGIARSQLESDLGVLPGSPMGRDASGPFEMILTPLGSPSTVPTLDGSSTLPRHAVFYDNDHSDELLQDDDDADDNGLLHLSDAERVSLSFASSEMSDDDDSDAHRDGDLRRNAGVVEIRIPKKAWTRFGVSRMGGGSGTTTQSTLAWSYTTGEQAKRSLGRREGHWWAMRHPETGDVVGEVQVALKFRTTSALRDETLATTTRNSTHNRSTTNWNVGLSIPSVGVSFLHNANNASMVEVAYLSMQRIGLLFSRIHGSSEIQFALGNLQMDNQMESEVVLGPKVHRVKEGVSVRLRDRWRHAMQYRYRGILEQFDTTTSRNVVQFHMLWNESCNAGDVVHYELIELVLQEVEISTDEKFVVHLISVFQGLEDLTRQHSFDDIVNRKLDYVNSTGTGSSSGPGGTNSNGATNNASGDDPSGNANANANATPTDGIYIEELAIESIRIKFSMELNGGRHIKTLGPSGRRLAVYLPESNVKDFRLYLTKLTFNHVYEPKASVVEKVTRRYQQQAVILVLSGLHTVSVYANPFRIVYRLGHGLIELVRLPARGLASGSPVELLSGAYLGVRSLAMNTISASYEIVAGATGILSALLAPLVPDRKRRAFEDDLTGFQRAVIEEVDAFDAAEERTMTKTIVRKPRVFDPAGVGLLTVYGPGSVPLEEQDRIDHKAVVLLQHWWRRRRRANMLYDAALRLRPDIGRTNAHTRRRLQCVVM